MMNRIDRKFAELRKTGTSGFMAYITAGDPNLEATAQLIPALADVGMDFVELGVPFSDPLADGTVNQLSAQRALAAGTTLAGVLDAVRAIRRKSEVPIIIYSYLNPIYIYGFDAFHKDAAEAGVDGVLILDLPPEESEASRDFSERHGVKSIKLIAPTTPPDRIKRIAQSAEGFVYYVSREGVTGEQAAVADSIEARLFDIKKHTDLPIAVGFGISTPDHAAQVALRADAVVVGSAIVRRIGEHGKSPDFIKHITDFVRPLTDATHKARH